MITSLSTDLLIRIKNGSRAGRKSITAPVSKFCSSIAQLMKKYRYIDDYQINPDSKLMTINLAYIDNVPKVTDVILFSKPGRRMYGRSFSLPWGKSKNSLIIVSTSSGVMSQKEAKVKGLGGELIAEIW